MASELCPTHGFPEKARNLGGWEGRRTNSRALCPILDTSWQRQVKWQLCDPCKSLSWFRSSGTHGGEHWKGGADLGYKEPHVLNLVWGIGCIWHPWFSINGFAMITDNIFYKITKQACMSRMSQYVWYCVPKDIFLVPLYGLSCILTYGKSLNSFCVTVHSKQDQSIFDISVSILNH